MFTYSSGQVICLPDVNFALWVNKHVDIEDHVLIISQFAGSSLPK